MKTAKLHRITQNSNLLFEFVKYLLAEPIKIKFHLYDFLSDSLDK